MTFIAQPIDTAFLYHKVSASTEKPYHIKCFTIQRHLRNLKIVMIS